MIEQGVTVMVVGIVTVFLFLGLLIAGMTVMSALVLRFLPESVPEKKKGPHAGSGTQDAEIAAVLAAVQAYRRK